MQDEIIINKANVHNLRELSVKIPKNKFVVLTGVSGSGKSSLAFDTLYAEGQRRYVESLSSYARQFLGLMEKPDVESITGLSPAVSIDQRTSGTNPRSTVGTITEIYDYLRLLYARIGQNYCPNCGNRIEAQTVDQILDRVKAPLNSLLKHSPTVKMQVMAPIIKEKKGVYNELFDRLLSKGFLRVRVDKEVYSLDEIDEIKLNKFEKHNIEIIVDRFVIEPGFDKDPEFEKRLRDSIELSGNSANGEILVSLDDNEELFSEKNTCTKCGISFPEVTPATFSFNSPQGACNKCSGLGYIKQIDISKIYNPKLSILEGGIFPWSNRTTNNDSWSIKILQVVAERHGFDLGTPIEKYPRAIFDLIFYGTGSKPSYPVHYRNREGQNRFFDTRYEGVVKQLERRYLETDSEYIRMEIEKYMFESMCDECHGSRLKPYSLSIKINDRNINEISTLAISELNSFISQLQLSGMNAEIAKPIVKEIITRLKFLENVGLNYLSLERRANTLSGGESQRIRLASQIGTGLTGVLYVLDEPSIGLHPRDVSKLIDSLTGLRDIGNTLVVVEHDYETIERADWIIDIGPLAGENGGKVVAQGTLDDIKKSDSLTGQYLSRKIKVGHFITEHPSEYRSGSSIGNVALTGVKTHNLKNLALSVPLGKFVCITGVSGSGKSSLINDTLFPAIHNKIKKENEIMLQEGEYANIEGYEKISKIIQMDQSPIGRTPRSNPVTYTGVFTYIRELFAKTQEARARGYTSGRFSFNVKGGRCETCRGEGQLKIEMQFLPDMYVTCEDCHGKRFNKDALQIDYKGKNIAEVLEMTISEAREFFTNIPQINRKFRLLEDVGLGYIRLGQSATTLSGGESQRIKLARELSKVTKGHTVYILDEPTTGLHFYDIDKLLLVLKKLVNKGNSVIVVEHNLDIIKNADWIIDLGPEGGLGGGNIIAEGDIEKIVSTKNSWTGKYLKSYLESKQ